MLMTTAGQSVRIKVATVRETGRATQGVKLMTLRRRSHPGHLHRHSG